MQRLSVIWLLLLLTTMSVVAQSRKRTTPKEEPLTEQEMRLQQMTKVTQRITFIDSIVLPKEKFLQAYHLTPEAGRIAPYATFFANSNSTTITFMNALGNRCWFADTDSTIASQELLFHQWTPADTLAGINSDRQLERINYPFMTPDGTTLYFAAEGEESIGGYDIFMSTYDATEGRFLQPENIGMPFNSTANDYLFVIDEYNQLGFFASDRNQSEDSVCVYAFIPPEKYQIYDESEYTPEEIAAFARIDNISKTHDDKVSYRKAMERLQLAMKASTTVEPSFVFIINDQVVYHQLSAFRATGNQKRYQQLVQLRQQYEQTLQRLEKAREYYPKATQTERVTLRREIPADEQKQHGLYEAIRQLEKQIRQAENTYLTKKK